ncbi:MlaD family protein [Rhodoferax saidenbachensis]|uniref:Phospholipid/cholesterol/gamma-HCH transport system substrate-binding protein n=1 Tax=Rhodoferax saidenbachensis TaxID=1484693 RepID=A0ABU1ZJS4_9BURK|nr:MlaD family protein [Rhodoferax saidenbachensis]MDR7305799.1 phospholipid/cholesterol/gamma-HCH transport system substrate-binding protein [Rhodoferax saidenbachensis]
MNYALVGAFVLTLGAVLVAGLLWLASGGAWQTQYDVYLAVEDESVSGLNLDAPVKYSGVNVGKVQSIQLDPNHPQRVNLLFAIERGTPVKEDTLAVLKTQGLTGIAYVELSGGSAASPALRPQAGAPYPQIKTAPSLAARLENVLTSVLAKLDSTSNNINAILSPDNQAALRSTLADMAVVVHTVATRKDSIDSSLSDAATTLKNTARASGKLEGLAQRIGSSADAVQKMGTEVAKTSISTGQTVDVIGADVKRFSAETLPELERLLGELSTLSSSLRLLSEQTRRDPSGLIFGRPPVPNGPGELEDKP